MNPQHKALKERLLAKKVPVSDRSLEIRNMNAKSEALGTAMKVKSRHERRHNHGHKTSLSQRNQFIGQMSKE